MVIGKQTNNHGDEYITATELGLYLKEAVYVELCGRQTPLIERIKRSERGEFIFTRNPSPIPLLYTPK